MRTTPHLWRRRRSRLALAAAIAAGALGASAATAAAAPSITVTPSTGLDPDPAVTTTVTVSGRGFAAPDVPGGFYVSQTAVVDGRVIANPPPRARWIRSDAVGADGTFSADLDVARTLSDGTSTVDCAVTQCYVTAWQEHTNPDASTIHAQAPINFALPDLGTPVVTVSQTSGLPREGDTELTVTGTGFDPNKNGGNGVYVVYGPKVDQFWTLPQSTFGAVKWVRRDPRPSPAQVELKPNGTFQTTLTVSPTYTTRDGRSYDCREVECAILTFAAHGSTDRSLDTVTPLAFAPKPPPPPSVEVAPTTGLNPSGPTTVTVRGANFFVGSYVSVTAIVDGRVLGDQANARWMRANGPTPADRLNPDGTFTTTLTVNPTFKVGDVTIDCRVTRCAISTWRQHSNPTPATLFTSTPIAFAAQPADPGDTPKAVAPTTRRMRKVQRVKRNRTVAVGIVTCGSADCRIVAPRVVRVRIAKKRYRARVLAPRTVRAGARARVRIRLTKAGMRALRGRRANVRVNLRIVSDGKRVNRAVRAKIAGPQKKRAAAEQRSARR